MMEIISKKNLRMTLIKNGNTHTHIMREAFSEREREIHREFHKKESADSLKVPGCI